MEALNRWRWTSSRARREKAKVEERPKEKTAKARARTAKGRVTTQPAATAKALATKVAAGTEVAAGTKVAVGTRVVAGSSKGGKPATKEWECPSKGKQKGIQQVEANPSVTGSSAASTVSGATSTATAYRTPSTVNRVEAVIFEDGCPETLFFDISGVEEPDSTFGLEDPEVLVIEAGVFPAGAQAISVPIFAMDSRDHLDDWTYAPELVCSLAPITEEPEEIEVADVLAVRAGQVEGKTVRVVVDSGADV